MGINRTLQPLAKNLPALEIQDGKTIFLKNGIPLFVLQNESQKIIRLDIRLQAGSSYQQKKGVALLTAKSLFEGTNLHSRSEIFSAIDYQGAYMDSSVDKDFTSFSFYMPKQAANEIFKIIKEVFTLCTFPDNEILLIKEQQQQSLCVNLEKTSVLAFRKFSQLAFSQHPYGNIVHPEDYDAIVPSDLFAFFNMFYRSSNMRLFIAGDIDNDTITYLNQTFGEMEITEKIAFPVFSKSHFSPCQTVVEKTEAMQSSICIGKPIGNRNHPDWMKLNVLNMILGGYFGSRLMSDIREKKGLAYGIHSRLVSHRESGIFYISADVNADKTNEAIEAVYQHLKALQSIPVLENELHLVRNYYSGIIVRYFDGIFSLLDRYIDVFDYNLTIDYWLQFMDAIKYTKAEELQHLAQQYFEPSSMIEVIAGKKKKTT
jgi:zinc protease